MPSVLSRLRGLLAPTTLDQPLRLADGGGGGGSPLTTKGDLLSFDTAPVRVAVGANTYVPTADSTQTVGWKWAAPSGGGGGNAFYVGGPISADSHPGTANAMDDEFEATSLDAKWTWYQQNTASVQFSNGSMALVGETTATNTINALFQPLPGGGAWKFRAKAALANQGVNNFGAPLTLYEASSGNVATIGIFNSSGTLDLIVATGTLSSGLTAVPFLGGISAYFPSETIAGITGGFIYYEIELASGTLHYRVSNTGLDGTYLEIYSVAVTSEFTTAPDHIGPSVRSDHASIPAVMFIDFFRRADGAVQPVATPNIFQSSPPVLVSALPSAVTAGDGARAFVTDASSPTFGATVTGGGAVKSPVYSDGTNWKVG